MERHIHDQGCEMEDKHVNCPTMRPAAFTNDQSAKTNLRVTRSALKVMTIFTSFLPLHFVLHSWFKKILHNFPKDKCSYHTSNYIQFSNMFFSFFSTKVPGTVSFSTKTTDVSALQPVQTGSGTHTFSYSNTTGALSPVVRRGRGGGQPITPSSAGDKNG
jgi:hypothetical protein